MVNRINLYSTADIYLGDRLFCTFETSETPLDIKLLDELIEKSFRERSLMVLLAFGDLETAV